MEKKILYLDIDGVLANFDKAMEALCPGINAPELKQDHETHTKQVLELCQCNPSVFEELEPIEGALEAVDKLFHFYNIYFLSSPMWYLPASFIGKRIWIENHFGEKAARRLVLTHRKDLCIGDYLVDDRTINGAAKFQGQFIHFGSSQFPDWKTTLAFLEEEALQTKS
jgi:5'(3')-deoxyribonucleotidase